MLQWEKLFTKTSPQLKLLAHIEQVRHCLDQFKKLFEAYLGDQRERIPELISRVSHFEHEADRVRNEIQTHLPRNLFLSVDKRQLLEVLHLADTIANQAEKIAFTISYKPLETPPSWMIEHLREMIKKNLEAFDITLQIMNEMESLIETSFGGPEAQHVKDLVAKTALAEYQCDVHKQKTLQYFFQHSDSLSAGELVLMLKLIDEINTISHTCEKHAHALAALLESK